MSGIDPAVASALASRIDMLLNAISGTSDATSARAADAATATQWANAQPAKAGSVPAEVPPPASAQAELSETAVALNVISRTGGETAPPVVGRQPLWSTAPEPGAASSTQAAAVMTRPVLDGLASSLAMALEQALDTSGLFYESHLVQWLSGQRSSALLGQEPQARLPHSEDDAGWPFEPAQDAPDMPPLFTGRPAPGTQNTANPAPTMTGNEMVDVEIVETGSTFAQPAAGKGKSAPANDDGPAVDMSQESGDLPEAGAPATSLVSTASRNVLPNPDTGAGTGTALANPGPQAGPSGGYTPPPAGGSTFSSSANAAYAAQAANSTFAGATASITTASHAAATPLNSPLVNGVPSSLPIHPDALTIVRQQLELLQSAEPQFRWSGEAWPKAKMYWELDWDPEDEASAGGQRIWRTRISLELPTLGMVDAELTLSGHQLGARITADGQSVDMLKDGTSDFMRALASAGLDLQQLAIRDADGKVPGHSHAVGTST